MIRTGFQVYLNLVSTQLLSAETQYKILERGNLGHLQIDLAQLLM